MSPPKPKELGDIAYDESGEYIGVHYLFEKSNLSFEGNIIYEMWKVNHDKNVKLNGLLFDSDHNLTTFVYERMEPDSNETILGTGGVGTAGTAGSGGAVGASEGAGAVGTVSGGWQCDRVWEEL